MLREFIGFNRDVIISRAKERVRARAWPFVSTDELEYGVPRFLTELSETLRVATTATPFDTGAVLGRSLTGLRDVVDRTLSEVRLEAGRQLRERLPVITLLDEIAAAGLLHAEYRDIAFTVDSIDPALAVEGDPQLLTSAVMNLLQNAFKHTPSGGNVVLRARADGVRVVIEIEDECGGIPDSTGDPFQPFGERRGEDRSGLGLGLSIARKAVRAHRGDILIRNMPGKGCIFIIDLPLATEDARSPQTIV